ncbi:hypothetical protein C8R44DRAFT_755998 [Mycena epipterygia]|nr:hypothetical protein C8R44DRAFT_755998 [Mycena epipterygia]
MGGYRSPLDMRESRSLGKEPKLGPDRTRICFCNSTDGVRMQCYAQEKYHELAHLTMRRRSLACQSNNP